MPKRRVGIIGCGTIGSQLAVAVDTGKVGNASLVSLFDTVQDNVYGLKQKLRSIPSIYSSIDDFLSSDCDIVVEAASQEATRSFARQVLHAGKDLIVMSVGALADKALLAELLKEIGNNNKSIYIPTGAIAGIDAIRAVRQHLDSVTLTTTKNPRALAGAPFFKTSRVNLEEIRQRTTIYEGTAADAVRAFPANVNVAAVLSLAGIGVDRTMVRIVADPTFTTNQHEITAKGSFGEFHFTVNNVPSPGNPKTSYLAVLSAIECLRSVCEGGMRVGS
jgi:aspartate dehydrogenase